MVEQLISVWVSSRSCRLHPLMCVFVRSAVIRHSRRQLPAALITWLQPETRGSYQLFFLGHNFYLQIVARKTAKLFLLTSIISYSLSLIQLQLEHFKGFRNFLSIISSVIADALVKSIVETEGKKKKEVSIDDGNLIGMLVRRFSPTTFHYFRFISKPKTLLSKHASDDTVVNTI